MSKKKGYIYILTNPSFPNDLLKIGMTVRKPSKRALELYQSKTGVPEAFDVSYQQPVDNCKLAEEILHQRLDQYRTNQNREFFKLPLDQAKTEMDQVAIEVNQLYRSATDKQAKTSKFTIHHKLVLSAFIGIVLVAGAWFMPVSFNRSAPPLPVPDKTDTIDYHQEDWDQGEQWAPPPPN